MNKGVSLIIFVLLLAFIPAAAQKNFYKSGMKEFDKGNYLAAVNHFKAAYKKASRSQKGDCLFMTGECYRNMNDYQNAAIFYEKAIRAECVQKDLAEKYLAMMNEKLKNK